jgi:hypothetical protein
MALNQKVRPDEIVVIFGSLLIVTIGVFMLNQNWLVTSLAIFLTYTSIALWLCLGCELYPGVIVPQFIMLMPVMSFFVYLIER